MSANESQGNVGYIIAGVVAAAAVVTAGWPSLVEYGTAAIEWISSTLHDLPENEVRVCKLHVDCVAALRSHTLDIKSMGVQQGGYDGWQLQAHSRFRTCL